MSLPYIGKYGETVVKSCLSKLTKLIDKPVKFQVHWKSTKLGHFTNTKNLTPKEYRSCVVYEFTCPGCNATYIGKTDRNLLTRVTEHSKHNSNSEVFNHIDSCTQFKHIHDILCLPDLLNNGSPIPLHEVAMSNTNFIDSYKNWAVLLNKTKKEM